MYHHKRTKKFSLYGLRCEIIPFHGMGRRRLSIKIKLITRV